LLLDRAEIGYVTVEWEAVDLIRCYISPNVDHQTHVLRTLDDMGAYIRHRSPRSVLIAGDFNAHARAWGSPTTDRRGRVLEEWAAELNCIS
jgi:endonuclease/exonuclease/phosphatase (EEP) superfamily protein YafD